MNELSSFLDESKARGWLPRLFTCQEALNRLDNPQDKIKIIHIAGTNGKGSIGAYIRNTLMQAGFKVASYTSPALESEYERYWINGKYISDSDYEKYMLMIKTVCDEMQEDGLEPLSLFETETVMAFLYFFDNDVDYAVIECGMGGALDATNMIKKPTAVVFSSIGLDHMSYLGNTIEAITENKAGIIKPESMVFSSPQTIEAKNVLLNVSKTTNSNIIFVNEEDISSFNILNDGTIEFCYKGMEFKPSLKGSYQLYNACCAVEVLHFLLKEENNSYTAKELFKLIKHGIETTYWPYRFEIVYRYNDNIPIILDGAHNVPAINELAKTIEGSFTKGHVTFIIGVFKDKDYDSMFSRILPFAGHVICLDVPGPRGLKKEELTKHCRYYNSNVAYYDSYSTAIKQAVLHNEPIICFGSLSYLGDFKQTLIKELDKKD